jgi:D-arabinose 1-dehydrogenase-like Zn-dependent alcohol dehydrogenase
LLVCKRIQKMTTTTQKEWTMKAIVVTDPAAGTAGMKLAERTEPQAAINDVVVQVHASGFVGTELTWPSTWTDRLDRNRTPSILGHELAGVVTASRSSATASGSVPRGWFELEEHWCPSSSRARRGPPTAWRLTSLLSPIVPN